MYLLRLAGILGLGLASTGAVAADATATVPDTCTLATAPPPQRMYPDADTGAGFGKFDPAAKTARAGLDKDLRKNPKDPRALSDRGYVNALENKRDAALADFRAAFAVKADDEHALWSYGWARYLLSDHACAVEAWQHAVAVNGKAPEWAPATLALGYFAAGDKRAAINYFKSAVRTQSQRWGTPEGFAKATAAWPESARTQGKELWQFWQDKAP